MDERRHPQQMLARRLGIGRADTREVVVVLPRDLRHRNRRDVELLGADQMQEQIEGAIERPEMQVRTGGSGLRVHARLAHVPGLVSILMAARTFSMVLRASALARRAPSARMPLT